MDFPVRQYLDQCKEQGLSEEEVVSQLKASGWIDEHLQSVHEYYSSPLPKKRIPVWPFIVAIVVLLLSGGSAAAYYVAVDKIPLKNVVIKKVVSDVVFSLPFVPKSPRYLLTQATLAHKKVAQSSFDLSLATSSEGLRSYLGTSNFDLRFSGSTDISDKDNPRFDITAEWSKDFSAQALKPDHNIYFKINKFPALVTALVGIDASGTAQLLDKWVVVDTAPLETEARKNIVKSGEADMPIDQTIQKISQQMLDEEVLPLLRQSDETVDGVDCAKLTYQPTSTQLDRLYARFSEELKATDKSPKSDIAISTPKYLPSETIKNLVATVWIDKKAYYVRKAVVTFNYDSSSASSAYFSSNATVALALKTSNFGKALSISPPANAMKPEEYYSLIQQSSYLYSQQLSSASSASFKADISSVASALEMYRVDNNGLYPNDYSALVPEYLLSKPSSFATEKVIYKTNSTRTAYILYSQQPDPASPEKPYRGIDSRAHTYTHYSQKDIANFK